MLRLQDIQQALSHVVGWEQHYDPNYTIDEALTESESGLTFQGAHPLVTLENVRAIMPDGWNTQYQAWKNDRNYAIGEKCADAGKFWKAAAANYNSKPGVGNSNWIEFHPLSDFVERLTRDGIITAVQTFIQQKQLAGETRNLLERRTFFDGAARMQAIIDPRDKWVGLEIVPVRALGVTTKIERIGLQMRGAVGTVYMYLFHSSQEEPIAVLPFNYTNTSGAFQWFVPASPLYLPYMGTGTPGTDAGGAWYLCYNQRSLPEGMRALNVAKDWSAEPCQTCLGGSIEIWRQMTKYLQVSPFCTPAPELDDPTAGKLFDVGMLAYTNTINYGINAEITVGCDISDFIIQQRGIFATVLQKQVAASVLRTLAMNPDVRVNRNQLNVTREGILYELDGNPQGRATGLGVDLAAAYKALEIDTRGLDRICLQCNNHGVKYRTV